MSWNTFIHISTNEYEQKIFNGVTEHLMINCKMKDFHLLSSNIRKNSTHLEMSLMSKRTYMNYDKTIWYIKYNMGTFHERNEYILPIWYNTHMNFWTWKIKETNKSNISSCLNIAKNMKLKKAVNLFLASFNTLIPLKNSFVNVELFDHCTSDKYVPYNFVWCSFFTKRQEVKY